LYSNLPVGQDWIQFFRPATLSILRGESPYKIKDFNNAPWTLLPFIPFVLLPYRIGRLGVFLLGFLAFAYVAYKLKAKPVSALMFMTSFPVIACLYGGGLDWMPMISFVTPAPIALIFAAMKPQVGIGIGFYWLIESWQRGGIKLIVKQFYPVSLLFLISFALYGFWVMTSVGKWNNPVNISLFPYLVIIGIYLLYTRQKRAAMASSVCFAPYFTFFSLSAPLVALFEHPRLLFAVWLMLWAYPLLKALF
jgi:hypothetical protein